MSWKRPWSWNILVNCNWKIITTTTFRTLVSPTSWWHVCHRLRGPSVKRSVAFLASEGWWDAWRTCGPSQVAWSEGRRPLGAALHSPDELSELFQWPHHDDSTIDIVVIIIIIIIIIYLFYFYFFVLGRYIPEEGKKLMKKIGVWSSTNPGGQKTKSRRAKAPCWSAGWRWRSQFYLLLLLISVNRFVWLVNISD